MVAKIIERAEGFNFMRARNLKPSIFKNEHLAKLAPDAYRAFTGLWCLADRKGRLEDRPDRIEAEIFPFKFQRINMEKILEDLKNCEDPFIVRYEANSKRYIQIVNFEKHQYPHVREPESTIPAPDKNSESTRSARLNPESPILNSESPILSDSARARFMKPEPSDVSDYAKSIGFVLDGSKFCDHYEARGWHYKRGQPMKDWKAAVRTWKSNGIGGNNGTKTSGNVRLQNTDPERAKAYE